MKSVAVFGGYGTFGRLVCRELAGLGIPVVVVGRDRQRARALADTLGAGHDALAADARDARSCRAALAGRSVGVLCAGPFHELGEAFLEACLQERCHYVDIADDRQYVARVRAWGARFAGHGLVAATGCSSLPGISGALALAASEGRTVPPGHARVLLFIGHDNPKGRGAVQSLLEVVGQPFTTPQGRRVVFRGRTQATLPPPFGTRSFYDLDSPEYDLLPGLVGVSAVTVKVGFEWDVVNRAFALLARLPPRVRRASAALLARAGGMAPRFGSSGGAVLTELSGNGADAPRDGHRSWAAAVARRDGQRMAALPCALAAARLTGASGARAPMAGAVTAYELIGATPLLRALEGAGFEVLVG